MATVVLSKLLCSTCNPDNVISESAINAIPILRNYNIDQLKFIKECFKEDGDSDGDYYLLCNVTGIAGDMFIDENSSHEQDDRRILFADCMKCLELYMQIIMPNIKDICLTKQVEKLHICNKTSMLTFCDMLSITDVVAADIHRIFGTAAKSARNTF